MVGEERRSASVARETLACGRHRVLEVDGLTKRGHFSDISFTLRRREVIGIAGLLGSGRTSVLRCLMGLEHADSGSVRVGGEDVLGQTPGQMLERGVAMAPEDRRRMGFVAALGVRDNIVMASLDELGRRGVRSQSTRGRGRIEHRRTALGRHSITGHRRERPEWRHATEGGHRQVRGSQGEGPAAGRTHTRDRRPCACSAVRDHG